MKLITTSLGTKDLYINPVGIYLLKVNNRNTRTRCEICSKLTIETPEHVIADWEVGINVICDYFS